MRLTSRVTPGMVAVAGGAILLAGSLAADQQQLGRKADSVSKTARTQLSPGEIDTTISRVFIFVGKTGFGHQHAVAGRIKQGNLHIDSTPAGEIVFDMKSFSADIAEARKFVGLPGEIDVGTQGKVTASMLGVDVLDTENFPTATFQVKSLTRLKSKSRDGKPQFELDGQFRLHGVSRNQKVVAEASWERNFWHLRGAFTFLQSDFGIKPFKKALGAVGVADELKVYGDLWVVEKHATGKSP